MLNLAEEAYILDQAYVPEHCIRLMTQVSGGEPFLIDDFFVCRKENWIILIGYPLEDNFTLDQLEAVFAKVKKKFRPEFVSLVAPQMPPSLAATCQETESDAYFTLEAQKAVIRSPLKRNLRKARQNLRVEFSCGMQDGHRELMHEFVARTRLSERVKRLLFKMPEFVTGSDMALVLNAWDKANKLAAFYVVDFEAKRFSNYIMGCHSKKNYVLGASDLLLFELINFRWDQMFLIGSKQKKLKMIWEVQKNGRISHLVGTAHFFPYSFRNSLRDCLQNARVVMFEGPLDDHNMARVREASIDTESSYHLFDELDDETIAGITGVLMPVCRIRNSAHLLNFCRDSWETLANDYIKSYLKGDLEKLRLSGIRFPSRHHTVIDHRDEIFFARMQAELVQGGVVAFLGAPHLKGMSRLLLADGYQVKGPWLPQ